MLRGPVSRQHCHRGKPAGCLLSPIGIKEICITPRADPGDLNAIIVQTGIQELIPTQTPKVKMVLSEQEGMKVARKYFSVCDKLRAARA